MFDVGPEKLLVLVIVGLILLGPERLPALARDLARMVRNLRELATGARQQLRDELGPEFADIDLRALNPRTAIQQALLGDEEPGTGPANTPRAAGPPPTPTSSAPREAWLTDAT